MIDTEIFKDVLDSDEEIKQVYRPLKSRAYFGAIISSIFIFMWFAIFFAGLLFDEEVANFAWIWPLLIGLIIIGLTFLFVALWCNKTVYAVTNKRVLIRTGYIGVDYKSLNYDMLGALTVNVSWVDKLLKKDTGTIAFGSMSSPLTSQGVAKFVFQYIKRPYEVYREVKAIIDENKAK